MDDREIIWIIGQEGNEGKSWFQSNIQSFYGSQRVVCFNITNKRVDLFHEPMCIRDNRYISF